MTSEDFVRVFINPLHENNIDINDIDESIYDEILQLSNRFLMSTQVLKNIIYQKGCNNLLIKGLKQQTHISNLKNLINQKELIKVSNVFNKRNLDYVFLKGSAIKLLDNAYIRYARDLDVLVKEEHIYDAYETLKDLGYRYKDPLVSDSAKFTKYKHHLPVMVNSDGVYIELHHRVTHRSYYEKCPISKFMLQDPSLVKINKSIIKISNLNLLIVHIAYHAVLHHKFELGPIFLYDIKRLNNIIDDKNGLIALLKKINLINEYDKICNYINDKKSIDAFNIFGKSKILSFNKSNPKKFSYLIFSRQGRKEFSKIIIKKFTYNEDLYQTSKFSFKFYLILFIEFKNHLLKLFKFYGRDGRI